MDTRRTDLVLQLALAFAAERDGSDRELTATQLMKYVYLGDLAFAERNAGASFTGAPWRFGDHGPFADEVHARIEPVVRRLGADTRSAPNAKPGSDGARYSLADTALLGEAEAELPLPVVGAVKHAVREYVRDLRGLLDRVYRTAPMLRAAPEEPLDLALAEPHPARAATAPAPPALPVKEQRRRAAALDTLKAAVAQKLAARAPRRTVAAEPPPAYDALFREGTAWLDAEPGEPVSANEYTATVGDSVWTSEARRENKVP